MACATPPPSSRSFQFVCLTFNNEPTPLLSELKTAHQQKTLRQFLETVDPNKLVANLPPKEGWDNFPYCEILQEAIAIYRANPSYEDERVNGQVQGLRLMNGLLCVLTQEQLLESAPSHAMSALNVFNNPESYRIFIEILKHSSTTHFNTISVHNMLLADSGARFIPENLFQFFFIEQKFQVARNLAFRTAAEEYEEQLKKLATTPPANQKV